MFRPTVHCQPGMRIRAEKNKGVGFVITQQHVITRLIQLDVVVLEQQRFRFGVRHRHIDLLNERNQRFGLTRSQVAAEIAGKPFFQVFRFTHIDNRTTDIIHTINAGLTGYGF